METNAPASWRLHSFSKSTDSRSKPPKSKLSKRTLALAAGAITEADYAGWLEKIHLIGVAALRGNSLGRARSLAGGSLHRPIHQAENDRHGESEQNGDKALANGLQGFFRTREDRDGTPAANAAEKEIAS